jgi:4-hydroxy-3-polyprenylbenzoate decarboxylase
MYKDLREYIAKLDEEGELHSIPEEVDWNLEIGAVIRRSYDLKAPAPFFQKIKDYPKGYRILGAPIGTSNKPNRYHSRLAISFGLDPDSTYQEILESYLKKKRNPIKPILVKDGPCKENIQIGKDVDILKFPVPLLHEGDGGRYIGTWHIVVTKDPDSDWVNWGMYRMMVHDKNTVGCTYVAHDIAMLYQQKYEPRGKPMEFAAVFGTEPVTPLIGATPVPLGVSEADIIGGLRGEPLELIKCETVDLTVPATAEIVIEGTVNPHERREEGPFGEYTGYRAGPKSSQIVVHVSAVTHRNDPILPVSCMGVPVDDAAVIQPFGYAAEVLDELRARKFPVKMVYCPPDAVSHMIIVSSEIPHPNYAKQVANVIWSARTRSEMLCYVVVVEDDVDPTNLGEVLHAVTTKAHPDRGIHKDLNTLGHMLLPFLNRQEQRLGVGSHVLFDCTWPKNWPKEDIPVKSSFNVIYPKDIQEKVLKKWDKEYGY